MALNFRLNTVAKLVNAKQAGINPIPACLLQALRGEDHGLGYLCIRDQLETS